MKLEMDGKGLFEALVGYGKYGGNQLEESWNDRAEFVADLQVHIAELERLYDQLEDPNINHDLDIPRPIVGDVWNFLQEFCDQLQKGA